MAVSIRDIIIDYIDQALDVDDLENIGDFVRSVITVESLSEWQLSEVMRRLHSELTEAITAEQNRIRRMRLKAALAHFEVDFSNYLIIRETESLPGHNYHD